ncbi:TIGR00730 family Rossman fold protein [uncultured Corynebacterium sp.]|uniref:LOG family protein n=1 Tax=uncultured Corynebacterium sp. TaxID=159447 RepID=UPI00259A1D66|nr:TIGR00730 family Rossman fold protein [uncultured Corynebacterium sp.]
MKSVAVYCGSAVGNSPAYSAAAQHLGGELARRGLNLVYGGGNIGLMREVANSCLQAGGTVTGVMPQSLVDLEISHPGLTRLEVVDSMAERKTRMEQLADAFICLPGGVGTLEEVTEVLTQQQLGSIRGPVGLVDVEGFWQPFYDMYAAMAEAGFILPRFVKALVIEGNSADVLDGFAQWHYPGTKWNND